LKRLATIFFLAGASSTAAEKRRAAGTRCSPCTLTLIQHATSTNKNQLTPAVGIDSIDHGRLERQVRRIRHRRAAYRPCPSVSRLCCYVRLHYFDLLYNKLRHKSTTNRSVRLTTNGKTAYYGTHRLTRLTKRQPKTTNVETEHRCPTEAQLSPRNPRDALFVLDLRPRDHVTVALRTLNWLPVGQRITYKLCTLMHGVAFGHAPTYLLDAVVPLSTLLGRAHLRSADNGQYDVPRVSSSVGSRAFYVAGPRAWNRLPTSLRQMESVATFKRHLKTKLFRDAYTLSE